VAAEGSGELWNFEVVQLSWGPTGGCGGDANACSAFVWFTAV